MAQRIWNFAAGPAVMPLPVLERAAREMVCHGEDGMSVMEMSHRTKMYEDIIFGAEADLRKLMGIPDNYRVLFLQGGATLQFSMVPINLYRNSFTADFTNTGAWTQKAIKEAKKVGEVNIVADCEADGFTYIPELDRAKLNPKADFLYMVTNNTIFGTRWTKIPQSLPGVPLVADASSNILSEVMDVEQFGLIYFGCQKNAGGPGVTVVVIRDDLLGFAPKDTPTYLDYKIHADSESMNNTPSTYSIYLAGLVYRWMLDMGGVPAMQKLNEHKAALLYDCIDNSSLYKGTVTKQEDRSLMNVTFVLPSDELNNAFDREATAAGLLNLKGHRSVGGIRASIYNAMPLEGVQALIAFMKEFESKNK